MNRMTKKVGMVAVSAVLGLMSIPSHAAIQTLVGTHVTYQFDDTLMGLFGLPTLSGDVLTFTPTNFLAQSSNGTGLVLTSATINLKMFANSSASYFSGITVHEAGDYALIGSDAQVSVGGEIRAYSLANPLPTSTHQIDPIVATAPLTTTTTVLGYTTTDWFADAMVTVPLAWNDGGVNLTIENHLLAYTSAVGSLAFIEKKFVGTAIVITPVPEAETYAMMLAGLGLIGFMVRRRAA